jgi:tetratricopeptide (TPR) repeat protein
MTLYLLTILILQGSIGLETTSDANYKLDSTLAIRVVDFISQEQYETALAIADSLITETPGEPQGWFVKASVHSIKSADFEDELDDVDLYSSSDSVITICKRLINSGDESPDLRFYYGSVLGYLSFHAYKRSDYLEALRLGTESADFNNEALKIDSAYWDAYIGLGSFYFHRSDKAGILRSIGLIEDRREQGVEMLKICAEKGTFSSIAAKSQLVWLYISLEKYDEAISTAKELLELYPHRRPFLRSMGEAQLLSEHWSDALVTYQTLLESVRKAERNNGYIEIGCLKALAKAHYELSNWLNVISLADEVFGLDVSDDVSKRKSEDLNNLKMLKEEALKRIEQK